MRILLDECLPKDLKGELVGHTATTVGEMGWSGIKNGKLLTLAEHDFDVFLTADRNVEHQQNMGKRQIVLIVLISSDTKLETLRPLVPSLLKALPNVAEGMVTHIPDMEQGS